MSLEKERGRFKFLKLEIIFVTLLTFSWQRIQGSVSMQGSQKVSSMDVQLYGKGNTNNDGQRPVFLDGGEICNEVVFIL